MRARRPSLERLIGSGRGDRPHDVRATVAGGCHSEVGPGSEVRGGWGWRSVPGWPVPDSGRAARSPGDRLRRRARGLRSACVAGCGDDGPTTHGDVLRRGPGARHRAARRRRRPSPTSPRTSTSTGARARRAAGHRSRTGRRWCSTSRRPAPSSPPTRRRCSGRCARAYRTEGSAVAVHDFLLANCNVDLGPGGDDRVAPGRSHPPATRAGDRRPADAPTATDQATAAISPRRVLTSSHRPYSTASSAVNQRSRSESAWICSSDLPEWWAMSSAIRRFV